MFDLHTSILDEYGEEVDGDRLADYVNDLMNEFAESPEGRALAETYDNNWRLPQFMKYVANYFGETVATISAHDADEILFDMFPRKVSTEPENAGAIIAEQRAFWRYLKRTRNLPQADDMLERLTEESADELESLLADASNFGVAKSFVMGGMAAGFDMQSQEGTNAYMAFFNASLAGKSLRPDRSIVSDDEPDDDWEPSFAVAPIHKEESRVGRNDACPCGSGRKYKKCCGASWVRSTCSRSEEPILIVWKPPGSSRQPGGFQHQPSVAKSSSVIQGVVASPVA